MHRDKVVIALVMFGLAALPAAGGAADLIIGGGMASGYHAEINVTADGVDFELGRFSLLLAVNEKVTALQRVEPGTTLETCGYESFSYRYVIDSLGEYDLGDFTRLVLIEGILASPGGTYPCATSGTPVDLARLHFLATSDPSYEYFAIPVGFYWRDCFDNALFSRQGDTVQVVDSLYFEWVSEPVTNMSFPGFGVPDLSCEAPTGITLVRGMNGHWGGVEWGYSECYSGDLNLNGVRYEISDLVLYTSYFLLGLFVFEPHVQASIAESDINCDGLVLTVADVVCLVRIIAGDAYASYWKPVAAEAGAAKIAAVRDAGGATFTLTSTAGLGVGWLRFDAEANAEITVTGAPAGQGRFEGEVSVLLADTEGLQPAARPGEPVVIWIADPNARISYHELVNPAGVAVVLREAPELPVDFALEQNYPNPFNPSTEIAFRLPTRLDWEVEIFNVTGQQIGLLSGQDQGRVSVQWDAGQHASGIYFYRLRAGDFEATKRMVLLK